MSVAILSESQLRQYPDHPANLHPETCRGNLGKELKSLWDIPGGELSSWNKLRTQIHMIANLPSDWQREFVAPSEVICKIAEQLAANLEKSLGSRCVAPHVHPTPSGGIQFEWEESERYIELEIVSPNTIEYYWRDDVARKEEEGRFALSEWREVLPLIRQFISRRVDE